MTWCQGRDQRNKINEPVLAVQLGVWQRRPACAPSVAMRPEAPNDPAVELVEALADVGFAVIQTPAANDRIDLGDQLLCTDRSFPPSTLTNLILEMLDRFLTRNRVECALAHSTANLLG